MIAQDQVENIINLAVKIGQKHAKRKPDELSKALGKLQLLAISLYKRRGIPEQDITFKSITAHLEGKALELAKGLGLPCTIEADGIRLVINGVENWVF